jgi:hypothetical protein
MSQLQNGSITLQKRYFLIISATNLEKALMGFSNISSDLTDAGLNIKECDNSSVEACLKKLIPTYGNNKPIKFDTRGYEIGTNNNKEYYRTVMVTCLPKQVGKF